MKVIKNWKGKLISDQKFILHNFRKNTLISVYMDSRRSTDNQLNIQLNCSDWYTNHRIYQVIDLER